MSNDAICDDWADAYLKDWQHQNIEAILARHTDDSVFTSVAFGRHAQGLPAIGEALQIIFTIWPDLRFEVVRRYRADGFLAYECMAEATQAVPVELAGEKIAPHGRAVRFAVCDIFALRSGLIARKDSYIDGLGYLAAMRAA